MKEKIYTIPVTDAFSTDCECPLCELEKKLEISLVDYTLGPSLMEPDGRMETNENGFCRTHFEQLYNKQVNRLGLGLILDTHLAAENERLHKIFQKKAGDLQKEQNMPLTKMLASKLGSKPTESTKLVDDLIAELDGYASKCTICKKLDYTMDRYIDVIFYLWFHERDFRNLFNSKKGFCLKHLKTLLAGVKKYLNAKETAEFMAHLMPLQLENMERIQKEVNWFTQKFDYRNQDAPWGNSKDSLPRSIQKLVGPCELK